MINISNERKKIIKHHLEIIKWSKSLEALTNEQWFSPTDENKWSIAEIISHFIPWDEFILKCRIPYLSSTEALPKPPEKEVVNNRAALEGRKQEKAVTINKFITSREKLLICIRQIDEELWDKTFFIGKRELSLFQYFNGLAEHDNHHKNQIQSALDRH